MRIFFMASLAASSLAMAACGSEVSGEFTNEDGETGEYTIGQSSGGTNVSVETDEGSATVRSGVDIQADFPDGYSLIGEAQVVSNTLMDGPEGTGVMVVFLTEKAPSEVIDFYRAEAEAAGVEIEVETNVSGSNVLAGKSASGTQFAISAIPTDNGTTGQLSVMNGFN